MQEDGAIKKKNYRNIFRTMRINSVLTEIKCGKNNNFRVPGYRSIRKYRINSIGRGIGRVAIF